eukprot:gb/GECH01004701.1/.p1 GENE.gb/GECH01004701.1/~~gb/GECH01004701.1/.p1  ORF type:complete len:485 (+),score=136.65 gb/GECH01004701.1/:1-1455(+)
MISPNYSNSNIQFKVHYLPSEEIRRFHVEKESIQNCESLTKLLGMKSSDDNMKIQYQDDEDDFVTIESDHELLHAIHLHDNGNYKLMRIRVVPRPSNNNNESLSHHYHPPHHYHHHHPPIVAPDTLCALNLTIINDGPDPTTTTTYTNSTSTTAVIVEYDPRRIRPIFGPPSHDGYNGYDAMSIDQDIDDDTLEEEPCYGKDIDTDRSQLHCPVAVIEGNGGTWNTVIRFIAQHRRGSGTFNVTLVSPDIDTGNASHSQSIPFTVFTPRNHHVSSSRTPQLFSFLAAAEGSDVLSIPSSMRLDQILFAKAVLASPRDAQGMGIRIRDHGDGSTIVEYDSVRPFIFTRNDAFASSLSSSTASTSNEASELMFRLPPHLRRTYGDGMDMELYLTDPTETLRDITIETSWKDEISSLGEYTDHIPPQNGWFFYRFTFDQLLNTTSQPSAAFVTLSLHTHAFAFQQVSITKFSSSSSTSPPSPSPPSF